MKISVNTKPLHSISPYLYMQFLEPLGTADTSVDAGWDYLNDCWQPKLLEEIRHLAPTMMRFGGCFASFYHWKEAVGPFEKRTPILNLCWDGLYSNRVGTAEVVDLCRTVNAEPLLVVNMQSDGRMHWAHPKEGMDRFGTAEEAAAWVRYCNDPDDALRKSHGLSPLNVHYWQIGNETSYDSRGYGLEKAAPVTAEFAGAMHRADPSVKLIAWADSGWLPGMAEAVGDDVELMAFHHHFDSGLPGSVLNDAMYRRDPEVTWEHLMHAHLSLRDKLQEMREQAVKAGKRLAMTEGHYAIPGKYRCTVLSSWGAGVSYARCLLEQEHASDILDIATMADFFGNTWQNNALMLPTPSGNGPAYLQPVGEVMALFRSHIGSRALDVRTDESGVDAAGSISEDGKTVYLHLVNTDAHRPVTIDLDLISAQKKDSPVPVKIRAFEISEDPTTEIGPMNPKVFAPVLRESAGNKYILPAAGVAALEISL